MKRIVSFFGEDSDIFAELNRRAGEYAAGFGYEYRWEIQKPFDREKVIGALNGADVGVIDIEPYNDGIFSRLNGRTKLLVRFGVGYDKVDLEAASRRGLAIARTTGANTIAVAEMAVSLMLAARRKLKLNQKCVENGAWANNVANETVRATVGIVGFGAIGRTVARLLRGFECRIVAYDPFPDMERMKEENIELVSLEELFKISDAVTLHTPYSKETHHLVGRQLLGLMKETAVIVNTSRGNIIDEDALYAVLKDGQIAGAALDVFATEPLPADSPLIGLDNLLTTPHVSSQTIESLWCIYKMAVDIADDFLSGKGSPHILNPDYTRGGK